MYCTPKHSPAYKPELTQWSWLPVRRLPKAGSKYEAAPPAAYTPLTASNSPFTTIPPLLCSMPRPVDKRKTEESQKKNHRRCFAGIFTKKYPHQLVLIRADSGKLQLRWSHLSHHHQHDQTYENTQKKKAPVENTQYFLPVTDHPRTAGLSDARRVVCATTCVCGHGRSSMKVAASQWQKDFEYQSRIGTEKSRYLVGCCPTPGGRLALCQHRPPSPPRRSNRAPKMCLGVGVSRDDFAVNVDIE